MKCRLALILTMVWFGAYVPGAVHAAEVVVNTANDEFNDDGDCSLREAVVAATGDSPADACAAGSGADVIMFEPALSGSIITLKVDAVEGPSGDLDIYGGNLTIRGPQPGNPASIVIDGNGASRVFDVSGETSEIVDALNLENLTVRNGRVESTGARGGGIRVLSRNTRLLLDHVRVVANSAMAASSTALGGGIYTRGPFSFTNSVIAGNTAHTAGVDATLAAGGGLYAAFGNMSSVNTVQKLEISGNTASSANGRAFGGGVFLATEANSPPIVANRIARRTFQDPAAGSATYDLTTVFSDGNGDTLNFIATSSNTSVASVAIDGTTLVVTPVGPGNTNVSVTATDPGGSMVATTFEVAVGAPNQAPVVVNGIPEQTFASNDPGVSVDLTSIFTDPEGGELSFSATTSDRNVAAATVNGPTLTISPVEPGSATVSATAEDDHGATTTTDTLVTVLTSNNAPQVSAPIPDQTHPWYSSFTVDLGSVFSDPNDDVLRYTAQSSSAPNITATVNGSQLTVTMTTNQQSQFESTITVTADDGRGGTVSDEFVATFRSVPNRVATRGGAAMDAGVFAYDIANAAVVVRITNTTISGNTVVGSQAAGAGLYAVGAPLGVALNNVTLADNDVVATTGIGGGFAVDGAEIRLANTLVAGNTAPTGPDCAAIAATDGAVGIITSAGFNLVSNGGGCAIDAMAGDQVGTAAAPIDALLGPLGDNGGGSRTHALLLNSPAIDAANFGSGSVNCGTTDQRGQPRPRDGDRSGTAECDIGAYEAAVNQPPTVIRTISDQTLTAGSDALSIDLATVFSDPEGSVLQFTATSSDPAVVTVSISGTILKVVAVAPGTAAVTVTAADNLGALRRFSLRVSWSAASAGGEGSSSGGGCVLATGPVGVDPTLWLLVMLALLAMGRRRHMRPR